MEAKREGGRDGRKQAGGQAKRGLPEESQFYSRDQWEDRLRAPFPEPWVSHPRVCPCSLSLKGSGAGQLWTWMEQWPPSRSQTRRQWQLLLLGWGAGNVVWACLKNTKRGSCSVCLAAVLQQKTALWSHCIRPVITALIRGGGYSKGSWCAWVSVISHSAYTSPLGEALRDSFSASTGSYVHRRPLYSQNDSQAQAPHVHQHKTGGLSHCFGATSFGRAEWPCNMLSKMLVKRKL